MKRLFLGIDTSNYRTSAALISSEGHIIAQKAVAIDDCDSPEAIAQTVLREEHKLLPWVVEQICLGRVHVDGRRVTIDKA